jgi:hypothetical protein
MQNKILLGVLMLMGWMGEVVGQVSIAVPSTPVLIDFTNTIAGVNNGAFSLGSAAVMLASSPSSGQLDADAWAIVADGASTTTSSTFPGSLSTNFANITTAGTTSTGWGTASLSSNNKFAIFPAGSSATAGSITLIITNNTGGPISQLNISYEVSAYNDQARGNKVEFWHSPSNAASSYTEIASAEFVSTAAASNSFETANPSVSITGLNLANGASYYIRWFFDDVSGSGSRDEFFLDDISISAVAACTPPTSQSNTFTVSNQTTTTLDLGWTRPNSGGGDNVLVVARQGSAVNANPVSGTAYTANATFTSGSQIGTGNYVVYSGSGTSVQVSGLSAGTTYHFAVYEFFNTGTCYNTTSPLTGNGTTAPPPPTITHTGTSPAASSAQQGSVNNILYQVKVDVTAASATLTQAVFNTGGTWAAADVSNFKLRYSADATLTGADPTIGTINSGLTGGAQSLTFSSLTQSFAIGTAYLFLTADLSASATIGNTVNAAASANSDFTYTPAPTFSGSTFASGNNLTVSCTPPGAQASGFSATNITNSTMDLSWTNNSGDRVLVVARASSAVNGTPVSGTSYTANAAFGSGDVVGTAGNFAIYDGTGNTVSVSNLSASTTYHYAVFAYNNAGTCYLTPALTGNGTTASPPANITHTGTSPAAANAQQGSVDNILYQVKIDVATASATLTQAVFSTGGTWVAADVSNFKLRYSADATLTGADPTISTISSGLTGGVQTLTFSSLSQMIAVGSGYLFLTADVSLTATLGNTVNAAASADANFTYGTVPTFSGSNFAAGNDITVVGFNEIQLEYPIGTNVACGATISFGSVNIGSTSTQTVRIRNLGSINLNLTALPLTASGDYSITTQPTSPIPGGGFTDVVIQFAPTAAGARTGAVSIANDDSNENPCGISLSGTGVIPNAFYRTVQSGLFSATSTWEYSTDNTTWSPALRAPGTTDLGVTIQSPHNITVNATLSIDDVTVSSGATLEVTAGTLTVANGTAATDMSVAGILINSATVTVAASATLRVENNGKYQHNPSSGAGTIPTATWVAGSTCEVLKSTSNPGGLTQNFHHFIWSPSNQSAAVNFQNALTTVMGDFSITNTGGFGLRFASSGVSVNVSGNFSIASGTLLELGNGSGATTLTVGGNFTLDGSLNLMNGGSVAGVVNIAGNLISSSGSTITETTSSNNCEINFNGSAAQSASFGTVSNRVNIRVSNSQGVSLASNLTLANSSIVYLTSGSLSLGNFNLDLSSTGTTISDFASNKYIRTNGSGFFRRTVNSSTGSQFFPVGNSTYNPVTMTNTGTSDVFSVNVADAVLEAGTTGQELATDVVDRTWTINENTAGGSNASVTLQWNATDELQNFVRSSCYISRHTGTAWQGTTATAATGSGPYTQTRSGITAFSPFAVGSNGVLPITLTQFRAEAQGQHTLLRFATATEINNEYFSIERSAEGLEFSEIGRVQGAGNSTQPQQYRFVDESPRRGLNYYRLRQVDTDGRYAYSPIVHLLFEATSALLLSPSPATDLLRAELDAAPDTDARWFLFDAAGRQAQSGIWPAGSTRLEIRLDGLQSGAYVFRYQNGRQALSKQLQVQK